MDINESKEYLKEKLDGRIFEIDLTWILIRVQAFLKKLIYK